MTWVWDYSKAKGIDRLVLLAIADCANDIGAQAWPSLLTLARKANVSKRTIQRSIEALVLSGELVVDRPGGGRTSARYRVIQSGQDDYRGQVVHSSQNDTVANLTPVTVDPPTVDNLTTQGGPVDHRTVREPSTNHPGTSSAAPRRDLNREFDQFWDIYPRKVGKPKAKLAFARVVKPQLLDVVLAGASRYRDDPNRDPEFTAHPTTWLARAGWDDDPLPRRGVSRTAPPAHQSNEPDWSKLS